MSDETQESVPEKDAEETKPAVDLSSLKDLSFGPAWTTDNPAQTASRFTHDRPQGGRRHEGFGSRRDRRGSSRPMRAHSDKSPGQDRPFESEHAPRRPQGRHAGARGHFQAPVFRPTVEVLFYPEDSAFRALTKAIRNACRTYELFEVAHLILEKPERFVAVVKPLAVADKAETAKFYLSVPDGLPFETEEAAIAHVCKHHIGQFFTEEEVEVEPPKGNFAGVCKCRLSGELIAPPNYHRYQELLRAHHAERFPSMPYERFAATMELVKDPEVVNAWLEKMKKAVRYTEKSAPEGQAPASFDGLNAARAHLLSVAKDKVVREVGEARVSGRQVEQLPQGNLRRSIEFVLEQQRRFPLTTANNLRGRLRRMKFGLYKRGSKGISYVCAVKRRFRDEQTVFAKNLQDLITFIEKNPNVLAKDLPEKFLGIVASAPAKNNGSAEQPSVSVSEAAQTSANEEPASTSETAADSGETPSAESAAEDPNTQRIAALLKDLFWLVSEGYVTEYGDGRLFAPPPMPAAKAKQAAAQEAQEDASSKAVEESIPSESAAQEDAAQEAQASAQTALAAVEATLAVPAEPLTPPAGEETKPEENAQS